jgi:hypothetical protein
VPHIPIDSRRTSLQMRTGGIKYVKRGSRLSADGAKGAAPSVHERNNRVRVGDVDVVEMVDRGNMANERKKDERAHMTSYPCNREPWA